MATVIYKENITRITTVEIDEDDSNLHPSELEEKYLQTALENVATNGWGVEDVHESFFEHFDS